MNDLLAKKFSEILGKMDEKVLKAKLNSAIEMLKNGDTKELSNKLKKVDKEELIKKLNEFDFSKLQDMNISKSELSESLKNADLDKLAKQSGENGEILIKKLKDIIKN